jgi:hypothetical protein
MTSPIINLPLLSNRLDQILYHIKSTLPITINMFSQSHTMSGAASARTNELDYPTTTNNTDAIASSSFVKGLKCLTKVLERKVDRQIMTAQIRAYDYPAGLSEKTRYV